MLEGQTLEVDLIAGASYNSKVILKAIEDALEKAAINLTEEMVMKIGIIVHSFTGNTLAVAQEIRDRLIQSGHLAEIEQIKISGGEEPNKIQFLIENPPEVSKYDALIFGAPVRGFSISPVISSYLKQVSSLDKKRVACFVTKQLKSYWTGGKRAINTMKEICETKNGNIVGTGFIFWKSKTRINEIELLAEKFCVFYAE